MKISTREITVFGLLGALMWASKMLMAVLPNIHLVGVFTIAFTVVYRKKALYPIYIYVLLCGLFGGFSAWWVPYLYVWTVLWGVIMLLPKGIPEKIRPVVYMCICSAHGFLFGVLFAPVNALMYGFDFNGMIAWIAAGLPFDIIHGCSNFVCGLLIMPVIKVLTMLEGQVGRGVKLIDDSSADV